MPDAAPAVPVKSSVIESVAYSAGALDIRFTSGKAYRFLGVPPKVHAALLAAPSMGRFFGAQVRGKYRHVALR